MTIADFCLLAAVILTIVSIAPAKLSGAREYDNANPRDPRFYTPGLRSRSQGAHLNGYEAFPFFAAAVIVSQIVEGPSAMVGGLALAFVVARIGHIAFYLADRPPLRSACFFIGLALALVIFIHPAFR